MEKVKSIAKRTPTETATGKVPKAAKAEKAEKPLPPHVPVETQMLTKAKMIIARREVIAAATKELDTWREEVADYMKIAGLTEFGGLSRSESPSEPKWEGATGKELENIKEQLLYELPEKFRKEVIDAQKLCNALPYAKDVKRILNEKGITITEGKKIVTLKRVNEEKPSLEVF